MMLLLLFVLFFWYLPTGVLNVELCGERRRVIGTQGGNVTLPVDYNDTITVSWVAGHNEEVFAVTKPNYVTIKDDRYEGRLSVAVDGSLIMFNVTKHDEGIYEALIETQPSRQCVQRYHLSIYMFKIEPCGERRHVFGIEGRDVTLRVDYTDITAVNWTTGDNEEVFAVTKPHSVIIKDDRYRGRLPAGYGGSLYINNVSEHDEGMYEALIERQTSRQCVQRYQLFIKGKDKSCGERRVFSVSGEEVTLSAGYGANTTIIWVVWGWNNGRIIAVTEPGKPVLIKDDQYDGQLKAAADGSLIITNVIRFQSGHYGAFIEEQQSMQCVQDYHLYIYNMLTIVSCGEKIAVSGLEGGEVSLPVDQKEITYEVVWLTPSDDLVQTDHGFYFNEELNKRLKVTANGDLIITKLTREDSGLYAMRYRRWRDECLQLYELTVNNFRTINIIRLVFTILLIFLICGIVFEYIKTNKN